jgi:hypothetical protein
MDLDEVGWARVEGIYWFQERGPIESSCEQGYEPLRSIRGE